MSQDLFACRKLFSHQMSLHAPLVNKEDKSETQIVWKNAHLQFVTLVLY